ncbi:MAG: hypothetical protein AAF986_06735, partial [Pseudomonadota bacterium]
MGWLTFLACLVLAYAGYREVRQRTTSRRLQPKSKGFSAAQGTPRLVETLTDPRESASILLVQMAMYRSQISVAQKAQIMALMKDNFGSDDDEAEGLFSFGRMAVGQLGDAKPSLRRLLKAVNSHCTQEEKKAL